MAGLRIAEIDERKSNRLAKTNWMDRFSILPR